MPTQVINTRYEIIETESQPESAPFIISKARDTVEGRVVALQVLPKDQIAGGSAEREELTAAISEAARLVHPNIIRVYDQGEIADSGDIYIATEYMRGISLQERIRRVAPFSLTVASGIAVAVCEALAYAHQEGVTHGDLRPSDVLLSPEGQIKVGNFAYGRVASADAAGRGGDAPCDDVYAIGSLIFEMLTGSAPSTRDLLAPPSPRTDKNGVPPALDGIVQKALHPNLAVRYRDAGALLVDLQAFHEALRSGRALNWSPLTERRAPRPPAGPTAAAAIPPGSARNVDSRSTRQPRDTSPMSQANDEIEDERYAPDYRERSGPLGKILAGLFVIAVLAVIAVVWYFSQSFSIPNDIQVPNLIGKTMDEAQQMAAQKHFVVTEASSDYSTKWPENQIYQQDPLPGNTIKSGQSVKVYRSLGPRLLKVPRLVGETKGRALSDLQDIGLPEGTVTEDYSETIQKGVVINQTPDADSMVSRNTAVNFVTSKGPQPPDPPDSVQGDSNSPTTATIHWDTAPRAVSYTVYRTLNGTTTTVATGLTDTHFTDSGLQPDTSYAYTIDAVNPAGASGASEPTLVTTPAIPVASPVLPPNTEVVPGDNQNAPAPAGPTPDQITPATTTTQPPPAAKMRQFTISFRVPRHPKRERLIQFEVQDVTGTNLVYSEKHQPGDEISAPVQAFGNKITFRIFIDGNLVKQQTL